ncbi:transglutaminase-like domain-containing protein [Qipengyuania sediminis]|uniref:transglutaminase-like domain-containing protein n=1 Tax=Qipengyuania sediminis TaxID=1532023 RepID=UPI00105A6E92|nr:transglutaminase family protein [Qipengyuania sediminis]
MAFSIDSRFSFAADQPTDVLLQFEAAAIPEQVLSEVATDLSEADHVGRVAAQDGIGERIWIRAEGTFEVVHRARVELRRLITPLESLPQLDPHLLPGEAVEYLLDSRYCPADRFQSFVGEEFGSLRGGAAALAMRDWIAHHFTYTPGSSGPNTTALDSFVERHGVCRDYAHVLVTFARAAGIPARYVSCYAPRVTPQDFHAVAELFLADPSVPGGGAWHLLDATGMADPHEIVKIGVGRDAADVSFLTSFGPTRFLAKTVSVIAL